MKNQNEDSILVKKPKYQAPELSVLDISDTKSGIFLDSEALDSSNSLS